jgi:hypothetical protein
VEIINEVKNRMKENQTKQWGARRVKEECAIRSTKEEGTER